MDKYQSIRELRDAYDEIPLGERNSWPGYIEQMAELELLAFTPSDKEVEDWADWGDPV